MQLPGGDENLVEFNQLKSKELKEIEGFMHILNDWVQEVTHDLEGYVPDKSEEEQ